MIKFIKKLKKDNGAIASILDKKNILKLPPFLSPPLIICILTFFCIIMLFPYTVSVQSFDIPKIGEVAKETIIAPFTFDIIRLPDELEKERKKASDQVLLIVQFNSDDRNSVRKKFVDLRENVSLLSKKGISDSSKEDMTGSLLKELSKTTIQTITSTPRLVSDALSLADGLLDRGILSEIVVPSMESLVQLRARYNTAFSKYVVYEHSFLTLRKGTYETTVRVDDIPVKEIALEEEIRSLKQTHRYSDDALNAIYEMLFVYVKPNVQINNSLTEIRREKAARDILEITGKVIKDSEIVRKHQVVTADIQSKLKSLQIAINKLVNTKEKRRIFANNTGRLLMVLLPLLFLAFYLFHFHKKFCQDQKKLIAFALILLLQIVIVRFGLYVVAKLFDTSGEMTALVPEYLIPFVTGTILAAILFNAHMAFILLLCTSSITGVILGFNNFYFLYTLLTGLVSIYTVRNIRYRLHFFKVIPKVLLISVIMITLWHLTSYKTSFISLVNNCLFSLVSVSGSVFLAMTLTPLFEKLFDLTTDMTLVELSDMNHPILKRLSIEAAGTYNHSVLVGNLAESAAQKIGANALLARVASYYHDIGKIEKADYFVENNLPVDKNRHNKLAPSMSALIICSHVKDGAELAKKSKLPKAIQDVILQHHGTSTVSFFYEKALEQDPHKQVQEEDFRYDGPLPQSPEAAIIMLADSIEAASRSLGTSSPKLLRELVKKIIKDKFLSAQLDQSDLTLKDLDLIVEGFMPVLQGIFHSRIEYPKGA